MAQYVEMPTSLPLNVETNIARRAFDLIATTAEAEGPGAQERWDSNKSVMTVTLSLDGYDGLPYDLEIKLLEGVLGPKTSRLQFTAVIELPDSTTAREVEAIRRVMSREANVASREFTSMLREAMPEIRRIIEGTSDRGLG